MTQPRRVTYGPLDCIVVDGGVTPTVPVVLCHGYGAPGSDLAGLSFEWLSLLGSDAGRFRFIFPAAPLSLASMGMPDGRAWWPINMAQLAEAIQASRFSDMHDHEPEGVREARQALVQAIVAIQSEFGDTSAPLVLGGFSQGAMLALDTALRSEILPPVLLVLFSGTIICQSQWVTRLDRLAKTKIFQAHGSFDPILPFQSAVELSEILRRANPTAEFHRFIGPHTIDTDSIMRTAQLLAKINGGSP